MGTFTAVVAALVLAQGGGFSMDGIPAEARTASPRAFVTTGADPSVDQFASASGEASLQVRNRLDAPAATYGDTGSFSARLRVGLDEYRIELVSVGAPPEVSASRRLPFAFPTSGGVRNGNVVFGSSGIGVPRVAPAMSAISVFGLARIVYNGQEVDPAAPIEIFALATGVSADDDTHRRLPSARRGDTELWVYVPAIHSGLVPNGYLCAVFEDVAIEVAGRAMQAVADVPTEEQQVLPGAVPYVANLAELPTLQPPQLEGFSRDVTITQDNLPIGPTRPPHAVDPITSLPATPLPSPTPVLGSTARTDIGPQVGATSPATPLPQPPPPLNAVPTGNAITTPTAGPTIEPLNALGTPPALVPTTSPVVSAPAATGPGVTPVAPPTVDTTTPAPAGTNPAAGTTATAPGTGVGGSGSTVPSLPPVVAPSIQTAAPAPLPTR